MTSILSICTGNVCRSPAMQLVLNEGTGGMSGLRELGIRVESAGVRALVGAAMDPKMLRALGGSSDVMDRFAARQVNEEMLTDAALILTATRRQRSSIVGMVSGSSSRTYTLAEFARYCEDHTRSRALAVSGLTVDERLLALVDHARLRRGSLIPQHLDHDDISDPYGRSRRVHRRVAASISTSSAMILYALGDSA